MDFIAYQKLSFFDHPDWISSNYLKIPDALPANSN